MLATYLVENVLQKNWYYKTKSAKKPASKATTSTNT